MQNKRRIKRKSKRFFQSGLSLAQGLGMRSGAMAMAAGFVLFAGPAQATVPPVSAWADNGTSVTMKVTQPPGAAPSQALAVSAQEGAAAGSGVSMKVSRPPEGAEGVKMKVAPPPAGTEGVNMKVSPPPVSAPKSAKAAPEGDSRPSGVTMKITPPPPEAEGVSMKVAPPPPSQKEAPKVAPAEEQAPVEVVEEVAVVEEVPEVPAAPTPIPQVPEAGQDEPAESIEPVAPLVKIGAEDVGEVAALDEEGEEMETVEEHYRYIRGGKLNPFRPLTERVEEPPPPIVEEPVDVAVKKREKKVRPHPSKIEQYPLNTLDLVAIMRMKNEVMALVQIPDGNKGFIIRRGTYIGQEGGLVSEIDLRSNRVIVDIEEEDMFGNIVINKRQLSLQKTAGDF